jgi:hypothetical protein
MRCPANGTLREVLMGADRKGITDLERKTLAARGGAFTEACERRHTRSAQRV